MRIVLIVLLGVGVSGCWKTIHEAAAPPTDAVPLHGRQAVAVAAP